MRASPLIFAAAVLAAPSFGQVPFLADGRPRVPAGLGPATVCAVADLDGDGDVDLLRAEGSVLRVLLQLRGGGFAPHPQQVLLDFGNAGPITALAVSRVDGDQDVDLVVGLAAGPDQVLENDGRGVLAPIVPNPIPPSAFPATVAIVVADLDGRSGDDLLVLAANAPPRLLLSNAVTVASYVDATAFLPAVALPPRDAAAAADVDRDGDVDLVLGGSALAGGFVLLNDGAADFRNGARPLPAGTPPAARLAVADLTRDGWPDLVIASASPGPRALAVLVGGPAASFTLLPAASPPFAAMPVALAAVDVDGDRAADAALLLADGSLVLLRGPGDGNLPRAATLLEGGRRRTFCAADLEGDGDADLWAPGFGLEDALLLGDGQGSFVDTETRTAPTGSRRDPVAVGVVDVTGEGDPDLLTITRDGELALRRNDGGAAFEPDPTAPLPRLPAGGAYSAVEPVRLAAGGIARDLVVLGQPTPFHPAGLRALRWRNGALSDLSAQVFTQPFAGRVLTALTVATLGRNASPDAVSDLLVGDSAGNVTVLRSVSGAYQEIPSAVPFAHSGAVNAILVGDLDGDGADDLVVLSSGGPPEVHVAAGPAATGFRLVGGAVPSPAPARAGLLADLDGDGVADLLLATPRSTGGLTLLVGVGGGTFVDATARDLAAVGAVGDATAFARLGPRRVLVGRDVDEDLLLVRGANGFGAVTVPTRGSRATRQLRAVDLDADADLDVVVVRSDAEPALLFGQDAQLSSVGLGQRGRVLRLWQTGPVGAIGFVLVSPITSRSVLPGFGVLRLVAPATMLATPIGPVPSAVDLVVPAGLPPLDLPLQMVVFEPARAKVSLGNLERATITAY